MQWLGRVLCRLGIHDWFRTQAQPRVRECWRCEKRQQLCFYSNRTQQWTDR